MLLNGLGLDQVTSWVSFHSKELWDFSEAGSDLSHSGLWQVPGAKLCRASQLRKGNPNSAAQSF